MEEATGARAFWAFWAFRRSAASRHSWRFDQAHRDAAKAKTERHYKRDMETKAAKEEGALTAFQEVDTASVADPEVPTAAEVTRGGSLRLTKAELAASAGLDGATVDALETFGLLHADATGHFGDAALTVAHTAAELAAYGLEPRHLRPFRTAADREIGLVQQVVTPHRSTSRKGSRAGEPKDPTGDVLRLCIALHTALVRDGLQRG